jgi:D-arginine dehydrogenase
VSCPDVAGAGAAVADGPAVSPGVDRTPADRVRAMASEPRLGFSRAAEGGTTRGVKPLPDRTHWVIVGGGFAGAATAWALGRLGAGPGVVVEQESSCGVYASGRNAAMARLAEPDRLVEVLARRSLARIRSLEAEDLRLMRAVGGLTLAGPHGVASLVAEHDSLRAHGVEAELLPAAQARARHACLAAVDFDTALWCPGEGVVDIHALLGLYLSRAREAGFTVHTDCRAEALLIDGGRVRGVQTSTGRVRADVVIDASGAWAGRLGRPGAPLPLQPMRRHVFVSAPDSLVDPEAPLVWLEDAGLYFRPESGGLLLSPCDESAWPPGEPPTDPAAAELLADKIARHAPGLSELAIARSWACLRTFAPDRRPVIGADPGVPGLFHVSGLGGIGMMCSAAIGELAADLLTGRTPDWIDPGPLLASRLMLAPPRS